MHSILDDIAGIGPARRKALMRTFKSLEAVRDATLEQLANAPSMNLRSAQQVYDFFHSEHRPNVLDAENDSVIK